MLATGARVVTLTGTALIDVSADSLAFVVATGCAPLAPVANTSVSALFLSSGAYQLIVTSAGASPGNFRLLRWNRAPLRCRAPLAMFS